MKEAPISSLIAEGPKISAAYWTNSEDGVRIRMGLWRPESAAKGTILVFPGRTEYIEKYGRTAAALAEQAFATFVVDWRGQGLADRVAEDPMAGHVIQFSDYQKDVTAMIEAAGVLDLPKPWYLLGHSLGACIGLRALIDDLPVAASAFTAPMWGINLPTARRVAAWPLTWIAQTVGRGHIYAPGTDGKSYVLSTRFEDNRLTSDPDMYQYFVNQAETLKEHQIGGPSMGWLFQTLSEAGKLSRMASPEIPCVVFCGDQDEVVSLRAIERRMAQWAGGNLRIVRNAKHDLLSEIPQVREGVLNEICEVFSLAGSKLTVP